MSFSTIPSLTSDNAPLSERPSSVTQVYGGSSLSTDGELLALGFDEAGKLWSIEEPGVLRQWDPEQNAQIQAFALDDLATLWTFSRDCKWIAAGSDDVSVWEVATGNLIATCETPAWITALAFSDDQRIIATGHDDGMVRLWDIPERKMIREIDAHEKTISALSFSRDGKTLATAGEEKLIYLWSVADGSQVDLAMWHNDRIPALQWHPDGKRLLSAGWDTTARIWDVSNGEPIMLLNSHAAQVHHLSINSEGSQLLCADSDQSIHLWDLESFKTIRIWPRQSSEIRALTFAPDDNRLAWGGADRVIQVLPLEQESEELAGTDPRPARTAIGLDGDGRKLIHLAPRQQAYVWDVSSGEPAGELEKAEEVLALAVSLDGKRIAGSLSVHEPHLGCPTSLYLWDGETGKRLKALDGPSYPVTALAFSSDSKVLASSGYASEDVWIWDVEAAEPMLLIPGAVEGCSIESLAFEPNARRIAIAAIDWMATSGTNGAVSLWDIDQRKEVQRVPGGNLAVAFHPKGQHLATATLDRTIQIWNPETAELVQELEAHTDLVTCLAHDPEGDWLASGGDDFTLCLWNASTRELKGRTRLDTQPKAVCFSRDSKSLFLANGNNSCYQISVEQLISGSNNAI